MRVISRPQVLLSQNERAFDRAADDVAREAARRTKSSRIASNVRFESTGPLKGRVVSDLEFSKAHELGAYIKPKRGKFLKFMAGGQERFSKGVRLPKRPYLKPAGDKFGRYMTDRLIEAARGGR